MLLCYFLCALRFCILYIVSDLMRLIAKGVGDAQADVMAVMIGVIPLLHGLLIRSEGVVDPIPAIVDGLVCDMLAEGIVSYQ